MVVDISMAFDNSLFTGLSRLHTVLLSSHKPFKEMEIPEAAAILSPYLIGHLAQHTSKSRE